jgi:hypothetical protein
MNRYFQFLAGPRAGEILLFDKIEQEDDIVFVAFKDGSRCNEEFILPLNETAWDGKLMAEVSDTSNIWKIKTEWVGRQEEIWDINKDGEKVCVQPFAEGRKKVTATPPRKTTARFGQINNVIETPNSMQAKQNANQNDPVWVMMDKAKKFDTPIPMELTISLPTKSLYNVAKESFDEGGEKVIEYIISNIDDKKLKDSLRVALLLAYENKEPKQLVVQIDTGIFIPEVVEEAVIGDPKIENNDKLNG